MCSPSRPEGPVTSLGSVKSNCLESSRGSLRTLRVPQSLIDALHAPDPEISQEQTDSIEVNFPCHDAFSTSNTLSSPKADSVQGGEPVRTDCGCTVALNEAVFIVRMSTIFYCMRMHVDDFSE